MISLPKRAAARERETDIVQAIRAALNRLEGVRIWRNNTGKLLDANGRMVTYGLAIGSADLVGIVRVVTRDYFDSELVSGRFFALEVKGPRGKSTPEQEAWGETVRSFGGYYAVVHSVEEALASVEEARR